ncbi:MAG: hypothetical protein IKH54_05385 [Bacilli bacterium]|nr:hypothetical protein [Bacilli bacterium]
MKRNSDKEYFEYLIKNMLQQYNLVDKDLTKNEKPDFRNLSVGLEITRADQTLAFDGFISKYGNEKIENIKKFNKNFEKLGGKVLNKSDPIVKILNLHDTFHYHEDYLYIIPCYPESFDFVNQRIKEKLIRLNSIYDNNIEHYYLGIFTTIFVFENSIKDELYEIIKLQSQYSKKFEKIIIIFIDKICEYNLLKNTYQIIEDTQKDLNNISIMTYEELKK